MSDTLLTTPIDCIQHGDCRELLRGVCNDYFSVCITDPPYNYEFVGRNWDTTEIDRRINRIKDSKTLVKNIPYGSGLAGGVRNKRWYERVRGNIVDYQKWCADWGNEVFRTLRPGAFVLVFNSTRTVAHVQVALEEVGFYARDILVYRRHAGIPKGLNVARKLQSLGEEDWESWEGWHSCLRNEWEAICVLQKPLIGNYITTIREYKVGLLNAEMNGAGFLSNVLEGFRKVASDEVDGHCTVKPLALMKHLVKLTVPNNDRHIILDPFAGTGTTCLAAKQLGHHFVGMEINASYVPIAENRIIQTISGQRSLFTE